MANSTMDIGQTRWNAVQERAADHARRVGMTQWNKAEDERKRQIAEFGNYLSSGNYTTENNQKFRDMATQAVANLDEQMKRYGKSSNEYKMLDSYKQYYSNALPNFDRMDVGANVKDYLSYDYENNKFNNWHSEEDYNTQKTYLDQQRAALQSEMDAIEDQTSADYQSLKSWMDQYDMLSEALEERNSYDRQFQDINDYTAYERSTDYKNTVQAKQTLKQVQEDLKNTEAQIKSLEMKFAGYTDLSAIDGADAAAYQQLADLRQQYAQQQKDVLQLTSEVSGMEKWQKDAVNANYYLQYGEDADYQQILDDLIEARNKAKEGSEDWAKIDLQIRALAGENENGLNDNGQYDENTLYGRAVMRDFDTEAAQKRMDEIDQELKDLGVSTSRFWGGVTNAENNFGVDAAGMVYTDENAVGESDPRVMALRQEKTELTRKLNSAAKFQEKDSAEQAFRNLSEAEHKALQEEGLKHLTQRGKNYYRDIGVSAEQGSGVLDNFQYLDDEYGGGIRDMLIEALGAEALGKDIGYTVDDVLRLYEGDINHIAGMREAQKISDMDSDFLRWNRQVFGVGTAAGLNQFATGMRQAFSDDYIEPNKTAYKAQYTREDLKRYGNEQVANGANVSQMLFDTTQTTANMLPMIAASYLMTKAGLAPVAGEIVGATLMGLSSGGNTYQQALAEGWDKTDAKAYATILGAAEGTMQYLIGGIGALGGVGEEGLLHAAAGINNAAIRFATETGIHILSETTEELAQNRLQRYLDYKLGATDDADWYSWNDDDWYTVIVTALSTGALEGPGTAINLSRATKLGEQLSGQRAIPSKAILKSTQARNEVIAEIGKAMQSQEALQKSLITIGTNVMEAGTEAYDLASRMKSGKAAMNATNLGMLYSEIVSEYVERNGKTGYDQAIAAISGAGIKYNEIKNAGDVVAEAKKQLAKVKEENPGADVLGMNETELVNRGATIDGAKEFAPIINKVFSGTDLTSAEMNDLLGDSSAARAAREILASQSVDPNAMQLIRLSLTRENSELARGVIETQIKQVREAKAAKAEADVQAVADAAVEAADKIQVSIAAANADRVKASTIENIQKADADVQAAEARMNKIQQMSYEDMAAANQSGLQDTIVEAAIDEDLNAEKAALEKRAAELSAIKFPSKEQKTQLADVRERIAAVNARMIDESARTNARVEAKAKEVAEAKAKAAAEAKKAQSGTAEVIANPASGQIQTREQFTQEFAQRLRNNNPNLSEADALAQANARFDELAAQMPKTEKKAVDHKSKVQPEKVKPNHREKLTGKVEYWQGGAVPGAGSTEYAAVSEAEAEQLLGKTELDFVKNVLTKVANVTLIKSVNGVGANGIFFKDGRLYLDVNAHEELGQRSIVLTAAHELTHFIRAYNNKAYGKLRDFVTAELVKNGKSLEQYIKREQDNYRAANPGKELSRDKAIEEIVANSCETMLTDGEAIRRFAEQNPAEAKTILDWLTDFFKKISDAFNELVAIHPEAAAMQNNINALRDLWLDALVTADENAIKSTIDDHVQTEVNAEGEDVATTSDNGEGVFNLKTWNDGGRTALEVFLRKRVKSKALDQTQADEMMAQMDKLYKVCEEYSDGRYGPFSAWSEATVVMGKDGEPAFSVIKPNNEYVMNLDFSLVCKKRRALDAVFNEMIERGLMNRVVGDEMFLKMYPASIVQINNYIREAGFETACALCFVDTKRYLQAMKADEFCAIYNGLVNSLIEGTDKKAKYFNYGGDMEFFNTWNHRTGIETLPDSKLNWSRVDEVLRTEKPTSTLYLMAEYIKNNPEGRKLAARGDFMSTNGIDAMTIDHARLLTLFHKKQGQGVAKDVVSDTPYFNEVIKSESFTKEKAYSVGGVRIQSFSDYVGRLVFDYIQMTADLAAKELPAHSYTKEYQFAMQFGKTGIKINMSLVPRVVEGGVAPGLDANGNYAWMDGQSFGSTVYDNNNKRLTAQQGYELAIQIQNAEGYSRNCGTIAVGVSYDHIVKMLDDPNIRMIIPYHKSGINHLLAEMQQIGKYEDYTDWQTTKKKKYWAKGKETDKDGRKFDWVKLGKDDPDFNWNDNLQRLEREGKGARECADEYLDFCAEHGYRAKFEKFAWHTNYYKVLEDFTAYDKDGVTPAPLQGVQLNFPQEGDAFGSMQKLIQDGLQEDAVLQAKQDAGVKGIVDRIETELPAWEAEFKAKGDKFAIETTRESMAKTEMRDNAPGYTINGKSVTPEEAQASFSSRDAQYNNWAPEFYSKMANTIDEWTNGKGQPLGAKMAANQVVGWLKGKGVKSEEIKWSGIIPYLEGKKTVTKEELQQVMAENEIKIETKVLGGDSFVTTLDWDDISLDGEEDIRELAWEKLEQDAKEYGYEDMLYDDYGNLREDLIELAPHHNGTIIATNSETGEIILEARPSPGKGTHWGEYTLSGGRNYQEILFKQPGLGYSNDAMRVHWGDKDVIAHARVQDMLDRWGNRVLFVEEIQSDLHNSGAAHGFAPQGFDYQKAVDDRYARRMDLEDWITANRDRERSLTQYAYTLNDLIWKRFFAPSFWEGKDYSQNKGVIGLVGQSNPGLVLRWLTGSIDYPVNQGYIEEYGDAVVDTIRGLLTQSEWDSLQRDRDFLVEMENKRRERYELANTNVPRLTPDVPFAGSSDTYHEYVMKHMLRLAAEGDYAAVGWTTSAQQSDRWSDEYEEGYRIEYDQNIPKFMNKYGKQWGAKVGSTVLENGEEVWSVPVTKEMRKSVLETGQPMFSSRNASKYVTAEDLKNPAYTGEEKTEEEWRKAVKSANGATYTDEMEERWGLYADDMRILDEAMVELLDKIDEIRARPDRKWFVKDMEGLTYWENYTDFVRNLEANPERAKKFTEFMIRNLSKDSIENKVKWYPVNVIWRADEKKALRKSINLFNKILDAQLKAISDNSEHVGRDLGINSRESYNLSAIRTMFEELNTDEENAALGKKVFDWAEMMEKNGYPIPFKFKSLKAISSPGSITAGVNLGNKVRYDTSYFNDPDVPDQKKANTLLHEIIHNYSAYAIDLVDTVENINFDYWRYGNGEQLRRAYASLPRDVIDAVHTLRDIHSQIQYDPLFRRANGKRMYGTENPREMIAELANPEFREALKKKSLFQTVVAAVKRLFGINPSSAYDAVSAAFDKLMVASSSDWTQRTYGDYMNTQPSYAKFSTRDTNAPENSLPNPYEEGTLQYDILEHTRKGDLFEWLREQQNADATARENAMTRPPVIPAKGFVPRVTEQEKAAIEKRRQYLIQKKGAMKPSEKDATGYAMPNRDENGRGFNRFLQNVLTAKQTTPAHEQAKKFAFTDVAATHVVDSNKADIKWATDVIKEDGMESAMKQFNRSAIAMDNSQHNITKSLALGQQLLIETSRQGDMQGFLDVLSSLALLSSQAGKSLQAFRMLKQSGPIGELYYVQKAVKQLNDRNAAKIQAGKMETITVPEDLANDVLMATTEEEQDKAVDALIAAIGAQVPVTINDKWNAWRYLAMLGNARTHIRNVVGNAVFVPLRFAKDLMAAGGEFVLTKAGLMDEQDRRKSVTVSRELREFAKQDAKVMEKELRGNGKYNPMREILDSRQVLPGFLETLSRKNGDLLELEDWWFLSPAYQKALTQSLAHSGYSLDEMLSGENQEATKALNRARVIAVNEAQKATYRDFNAAASMLNRIKRMETGKGSDKILGVLLEGVLPFTKTPINILRRGVEYSPIGLATSIFEAANKVRKGEFDAAEFIDHLSAGLTGSAVVVLGYLLASAGVLRNKKDDKEEEFEKLQGYQDYSLQIGDVSATIDWAAPTALPLFTGGAIYQMMRGGEDFEFKDAWDAMMMIAEPMMSLSMLDGLNNVLSSASYAEDSQKLATVASSAFTSYLGQAFPTLAGQLARSIDGTRRSTYVDKNSPVPSAIQRFVQSSIQNKTPVWEEQKIPYIDQWGREDTVNSKALGALENFLSPSYINIVHTTDVDEELTNLYGATKDSGVLPSTVAKYFSVNGERKDLTADEYVSYATDVGQTKYSLLTQLFSDPRYMNLTDEQKAKAVDYVYKYANAVGKYHVEPTYNLHNQGKWMEEAEAAATDYQRFEIIWKKIEDGIKD